MTAKGRQAEAMRKAHAAWAAGMGEPAWTPRSTDFTFGRRTFRFSP